MVGWHHRLNGHEFRYSPGVGDGQGGLVCCDSWGSKELDTIERLDWTEQYGDLSDINKELTKAFLPSGGKIHHWKKHDPENRNTMCKLCCLLFPTSKRTVYNEEKDEWDGNQISSIFNFPRSQENKKQNDSIKSFRESQHNSRSQWNAVPKWSL